MINFQICGYLGADAQLNERVENSGIVFLDEIDKILGEVPSEVTME